MYTSKIIFNKPLKCFLFCHIWGLFEMNTELGDWFLNNTKMLLFQEENAAPKFGMQYYWLNNNRLKC